MTVNKRCTGYPSMDNPWLEYYTEAEINATVNRCSIYDKVYENNAEYPDEIALMFYGKKITYKEMFKNIDQTAAALVNYGVKTEIMLLFVCQHCQKLFILLWH